MSSRPIVTTRGISGGSTVKMVGAALRVAVGGDEPFRLVEQPQPRALPRPAARRRLRSGRAARRASLASRRPRPLSLTRPSAIMRSASRREARPARAMRLAMRSPFPADPACFSTPARPLMRDLIKRCRGKRADGSRRRAFHAACAQGSGGGRRARRNPGRGGPGARRRASWRRRETDARAERCRQRMPRCW